MATDEPTRRTLRRTLVAPIDLGATSVALLFWAESLRLSLLPRPPVVQGVLAAITAPVGYGVAGLVLLTFGAQRRRTGRFNPDDRARRAGRWVLAVATGLANVVGPIVWFRWQNGQRNLTSLPHLEVSAIATMLLVTGIAAVVIFTIARLIGFAVARLDGWLGRRLHPIAGHAILAVAIVGEPSL